MKKDFGIALGLSIIAFLMRLPFCSKYLQHWDSVNYALSLEHYDVRLHQPHPPGYFLYSFLGKLVNLLTQDANAALVTISLISGALGIGALYFLGLRITNRKTAIVIAVLGLTSPLHWFESDVALNYSLDFLLVTITAILFYEQRKGKNGLWFWSSFMLGITAGVRLQDLYFLGPLWLLSMQLIPWKKRFFSLLVLLFSLLISIIPMIILSGGLVGYIGAFSEQTNYISTNSSLLGVKEVGLNLLRLGLYLTYGLCASLVLLLMDIPGKILKVLNIWRDWRFLFFTLWITPAILFFFGFIRQSGYVMVVLPALLVLIGWSVSQWMKRTGKYRLGVSLIVGVCLINILSFLIVPQKLFGSTRVPFLTPTRASIVERDHLLGPRISEIAKTFDPNTTVVIAGGFFIRTADYYLRDFQATDLSYRLPVAPIPLPDQVDTLVFLDPLVFSDFTSEKLESLIFSDGSSLRYIRWNKNEQLWISQAGIEMKEK